jgi:hypothetical protein
LRWNHWTLDLSDTAVCHANGFYALAKTPIGLAPTDNHPNAVVVVVAIKIVRRISPHWSLKLCDRK